MIQFSNITSFMFCIDISANSIAQRILKLCLLALDKYNEDISIYALVLTGSFSRGEGSILAHPSGVFEVLGDMEFFVVLTDSVDLPNAYEELDALAKSVELELSDQGIICKIEFSPVVRNFFKRIRPSIFNYELLKNGKVVFGYCDVLSDSFAFVPDSIPPVDGFYLIGNRIVEQLIVLQAIRSGSSPHAYQLLKFYLDMAGSYLVVSGGYEPTYAERVTACVTRLKQDKIFSTLTRCEQFVEILSEATAYKLNPGSIRCKLMSGADSPDEYMRLYRQAMTFCLDIWQWELQRLFNVSDKHANWSGSTGSCLPLATRMREWLKFLRMAYRGKHGMLCDKALQLFNQGTPRTLIYAAAFRLCQDIAEDRVTDCNAIGNLLPVPCHIDNKDDAMNSVIDCWNRYVRSA